MYLRQVYKQVTLLRKPCHKNVSFGALQSLSRSKRGKMFNQSQARGNLTVASAGKHVTCVNHSKTCNRCWRRAESRGAPSRVGALKSLPLAENRGEKVTVSKLGKTYIQCHSENV